MTAKIDLTRNQGLVYDALVKASGPMTAYEILDRLRSKGLRAPLQVYRALSALMERTLIHRVESLNAFIFCRHPRSDHRLTVAFAICRGCGKTTEFADADITACVTRWSEDADFQSNSASLEIHGTCKRCRRAA